ncbi:MAG: bifunctional hydroxymethylpyrimidine kinase/phosphomethylpyrimidine kinase [Acidobacteria bacterium]|nr:bifunctional hydroxymethylpyrimidine kinase/phosphomethylpyrimidine kinase [Acidobacteriota bacterium]
MKVALTIAGSDPSGGAGIQADLKTFHQHRVYGAAVITLITVQNTVGVTRVDCLDPELVRQQIEAVLTDLPVAAIKTGALGNAAIIRAVARAVNGPVIVDPVMVSKHGASLLAAEAVAALLADLFPVATLVTPNLPEAEALTGMEIRDRASMAEAARRIPARAVLLKGGHLAGEAADLLWFEGVERWYPGERYQTPHTHGTGCTYSAAITALLAHGIPLPEAVGRAKQYIAGAIRTNPGLGNGSGPVNHFQVAELSGIEE